MATGRVPSFSRIIQTNRKNLCFFTMREPKNFKRTTPIRRIRAAVKELIQYFHTLFLLKEQRHAVSEYIPLLKERSSFRNHCTMQ